MTFAQLADRVGHDQAVLVAECFIRELGNIIDDRNVREGDMRLLGAPGNQLAAFREATSDIEFRLARWRRAFNPESAA